ncbi:MAG TPA: HEAT repeat domain-containing protein [Patescibacteria group bacterium]|nr:HEAT repeat domain-containing protein [Patescibacteria group bacterium]
MSGWLLQGAWKPIGLTTEQEGAIRCMGTNALPFLVKWVRYVGPPWRARLARSMPPLFRRFPFLVKNKQLERARLSLAALQMLGPDVAAAMPQFVEMMKQTNAEVALRALQVVDSAGKAGIPVLLDVLTNRQSYVQVYYLEGAMGRLEADGHFAVPPLVNCLTNQNWGVVVVAARWLGRIRMEPEVVVPALANCLDASDSRVKCAVMQALGEFRTDAAVALPSLIRELNDPDNEVRAAARNALRRVEPDFIGQERPTGPWF